MFDLSWTSWLGLGGLGTAGILGVAAYFLGAKYVVEALSPIVKSLADITAEALKLAWTGLKGLFDSVSDIFTVVAIVALTYFTTAGHYKLMMKDQSIVYSQKLQNCKGATKPGETPTNKSFFEELFR